MSDSESKKLSELRVVDLRLELENRGLDKNGVKQVLTERLQKALIDEGENPDTFLFKPSEDKNADRVRKSSATGKSDLDKTESEDTLEKSINNKSTRSEQIENGDEKTSADKSLKDDDPASAITLTLEEEEKIHDEEATSETASKDIPGTDEKKSTNEEPKAENVDKSSTDAEGTKKEGAESSSSSDGKKVPSNANPRAIWISNVAMNTRACDIKQALSQYGKVVGAKVVVNAKYPGTCCFGYVTMGSVDDANKVIENLNNTELNGQIIKIEKFDTVRSEQLKQIKNGRKTPDRPKSSTSTRKEKSPALQSKKEDNSDVKKLENKEKANSSEELEKNDTENISDKKSEKDDKMKDESKDKTKEDEKKRLSGSDRKSRDRKRTSSGERTSIRSRSGEKKHDVLTFEKIREARERQRFREKERLLREEARRRHEEGLRQKEIERRQRSEAQRLEREREKLRIERERIEREKNELIRLERERQKLERERIELEKMELQRTRIRLEEDRRAVKRPGAPYRREDSFDDRKRPSDGRHFAEPPPPPHFDTSSKLRDSPAKKFPSKEYKPSYEKRDAEKRGNRDYDSDRNRSSSSSMNRPSSGMKFDSRSPYDSIRDRELHDRSRDDPPPTVSSRITKDHRFDRDRDRSPHYRPGDRRIVPDGKPTSSPRIPTGPLIAVPRFESRNSGPWNSSSTPKPFSNTSSKWPPKEDSWRQNPPSDRWNTSGRNQNFTGNSNMNMTPSCPPPPGINSYPDRFDYNKVPSSVRKY